MNAASPAATAWNYAEVWEEVARVQPGAPALRHGSFNQDWRGFDAAADGIARWLSSQRLSGRATVGIVLRNSPSYLQVVFACFKLALVPVNCNPRYRAGELVDLWADAGIEVVVFGSSSADEVTSARASAPGVVAWIWCAESDDAVCPSWAIPADALTADGRFGVSRRSTVGRSGDDVYLLFTGGTTGRPKGVVWRQDDLFALLNRTTKHPYDDLTGVDGVGAALAERQGDAPRLVVAAPLVHGLGSLTAFTALSGGGQVTTLGGPSFSAVAFLDAIDQVRADQATIVGDAMARPVLTALRENPGRWALSSLRLFLSSGAAWTAEVKSGLMEHATAARCVDVLGASEAISVATSITRPGDDAAAAGHFTLSPHVEVRSELGQPVPAGEKGRIQVNGRGPLGYLGDAAASIATFGAEAGRLTKLDDWASVRPDGSIDLLGRGASVINTGGEKVFPDEVELALRTHPDVDDAAVVGVADDVLGERVVAIVQTRIGATVSASGLCQWLRPVLAGYKVPKTLHLVLALGRLPNGKLDRRRLEARAADLESGGALSDIPADMSAAHRSKGTAT